MAGHPQSCDDHDPCTVDTLNGKRCEHKPKICDDGNPNTFDYCFGGVCYNTTTSCDDGNNCTIDSFNGTACVHTPKNCDDQNACTIDTCVNGKCVHTPRNCDDGNPCTVDYCDSCRGACIHLWSADRVRHASMASASIYIIPMLRPITLLSLCRTRQYPSIRPILHNSCRDGHNPALGQVGYGS